MLLKFNIYDLFFLSFIQLVLSTMLVLSPARGIGARYRWPGRGVRVRARRERDRVERGEGQLFHEAPGLRELGVRLAGKAGDEVRREMEARVQTHRACRERSVALRHDAAAHPLEDAERARLPRQLQTRDDGARVGGEIDEGLAGLHGLERGEPDPARRRVVFEPRQERSEEHT